MILGHEESKILKIAVSYHSEITDGVVQYDYETGELFGAGFTTGTVENPANPFVEVFRLKQGEWGEIDCRCYESGDCPYWIEDEDYYADGYLDEDKQIDGIDRITCCINGYVDSDDFSDDFDSNFRDGVEEQVREVLKDHLLPTLEKMNKIRCELIYVSNGLGFYQEAIQQNWVFDVLDTYVDSAMDDGFNTTIKPVDYLDAEMVYITDLARYDDSGNSEEEKLLGDVAGCLMEYDLDGALELLQ